MRTSASPPAGKLTSVKVKVGDHVEAGDVLAKSTVGTAKHALEQAEANLGAQQAGLDRLTSATTVSGAASTVAQARTVVSATKDQVAATAEADQKAVDRAKTQLDTDEDAEDPAESAVKQLKAAVQVRQLRGAAAVSTNSALLQQAQQQLQAGDTAGANETLQQLNSQLGASASSAARPPAPR